MSRSASPSLEERESSTSTREEGEEVRVRMRVQEQGEEEDDEEEEEEEGRELERGDGNSAVWRSGSSEYSDENESSSVAISISSSTHVPGGTMNMTFSSQVMVNVEEFVYHSVKLGIKFQQLNNNIVVGPYFDGDVPPPLADMLDAMRTKCDPATFARAQGALLVAEAIEREADIATMHTLTREDIHLLRRQASPDDTFCCKGLIASSCKNTLLSYPPPLRRKSSNQRRPSLARQSPVEKQSKPKRVASLNKIIVTVGGVEVVVARCRDGSIGWTSLQHLALSEDGAIQESTDAPPRARPVIHGVKPAKNSSADSFHINTKKQGGASNPLNTDDDSVSRPVSTTRSGLAVEQVREVEEDDDSDIDQDFRAHQEASWADEQSVEVMTYYINAASVSQTNLQHAAAINLPEATATATPVSQSSPVATQVFRLD